MNNDLISREALKECARVVFDKDLGRLRVVDVSDIDNAPTVEAYTDTDLIEENKKGFNTARRLYERPQGEWINTRPPEMSDNIVCSLCGYDSIASFKYCPNCGADMRGGARMKGGAE